MIKILCTSQTINVHESTGVSLEKLRLPLVAGDTGVEVSNGITVEVEPNKAPAVGGNGGTFVLANLDEEVTLICWHELDHDPIYSDEMQGYLDLNGQHTEKNYTELQLPEGGSYEGTTISSNVLTVSILGPIATIQPV